MAKKVSYLDNLQKELGQLRVSAREGTNRGGKPIPGKQAQYKKALGQAVGAAIQGRRYDSRGNQIR